MYKEDLALNNLQWLICHKIKPNQTMNYSKASSLDLAITPRLENFGYSNLPVSEQDLT